MPPDTDRAGQSRQGRPSDQDVLRTLFDLGREVTAVLDLDELLTKVPQLISRLVEFQTFACYLLDEKRGELALAYAVGYPADVAGKLRLKVGQGLVGMAVAEGRPLLVDEVLADQRYVETVPGTRSALVVPLRRKGRTLGALNLQSPTPAQFSEADEAMLRQFAAAVSIAIENARLYETLRANEVRLENELRFAQRVQAALLPAGPPKRMKGVDVAARFEPARELGGDLYDFLAPEPNQLIVAVGDVSGKGVPAALYGAFAGELIRSRTFRRRYTASPTFPSNMLASINTILHERELSEFYCTLCYAQFDLKHRTVMLANSGLPYPIRSNSGGCTRIELPGVPLGSFAGSSYEDVQLELSAGDLFVFCTDGVFEASNANGEEFGEDRLIEAVAPVSSQPAAAVVDAVFEAVRRFRGDTPPNDDTTAVAVRIAI